MVPLKDLVVFPRMVVPFFVGRRRSVRASRRPWPRGKPAVPRHPEEGRRGGARRGGHPPRGHRGAHPADAAKLPDGKLRLLVEGVERAAIVRFTDSPPRRFARCETHPRGEAEVTPQPVRPHARGPRRSSPAINELSRKVPPEAAAAVQSAEAPRPPCRPHRRPPAASSWRASWSSSPSRTARAPGAPARPFCPPRPSSRASRQEITCGCAASGEVARRTTSSTSR